VGIEKEGTDVTREGTTEKSSKSKKKPPEGRKGERKEKLPVGGRTYQESLDRKKKSNSKMKGFTGGPKKK